MFYYLIFTNDVLVLLASDSTTPSLRYLYEHITPTYAADWKVIGVLLDIPSADLKTIEASCPSDPRQCCNKMLEKWLEVDPGASWITLYAAIQSPALSSMYLNN